jgi:1,3-beta-glucanosyltransferase GAS5
MTGVYSGGLAYEYSMEDNGYGMVTIGASGVTEDPSFSTYQQALANNPGPSGDGGYNATGGASACPPKDSEWNVTSDALPAIPANAQTVSVSQFQTSTIGATNQNQLLTLE